MRLLIMFMLLFKIHILSFLTVNCLKLELEVHGFTGYESSRSDLSRLMFKTSSSVLKVRAGLILVSSGQKSILYEIHQVKPLTHFIMLCAHSCYFVLPFCMQKPFAVDGVNNNNSKWMIYYKISI